MTTPDRRPAVPPATGLDFNEELQWCSHCRAHLIDPGVEKRHLCAECWPLATQMWKIESVPFIVVLERLNEVLDQGRVPVAEHRDITRHWEAPLKIYHLLEEKEVRRARRLSR